jgi:hypothetical protein
VLLDLICFWKYFIHKFFIGPTQQKLPGQALKAPGVLRLAEFPENGHMKVERLSALCTGRLYLQNIFILPHDHSAAGWIK